MKSALVLASLLSSAAAFVPAQTESSKTALKAFENDIGATNLDGDMVCWDPLNFVANGDQERFDHLRRVELKHGRVAMLATLGYASTWGTAYRFPGAEKFPAGFKALSEISPKELILPILTVCGMLELYVFKQKEGSFAGDMGGGKFPVGFGPFATTQYDETDLRTKELLNGRAAQMGILGMMVHEQLNGKPFIFFDKFEPYFLGPSSL